MQTDHLGHGRPGALPNPDGKLLPRRPWRGLWYLGVSHSVTDVACCWDIGRLHINVILWANIFTYIHIYLYSLVFTSQKPRSGWAP